VQEETTQKTIALTFRAARLTSEALKTAMKAYLNHRKTAKQDTHGKMSVKQLVRQGSGVSTIEINEHNIRDFQRTAAKYGIDFAVKKDKTVQPPKYIVFFKGKDKDAVAEAFKDYAYGNEKKKSRVSVREKLAFFKKLLSKHHNRERQRERAKGREDSR